MFVNPITLRKAKIQWKFNHSECKRVTSMTFIYLIDTLDLAGLGGAVGDVSDWLTA